MYGLEMCRDLIQRLYDHAPPPGYCHPRSSAPYAAAMCEAVDILRHDAATKGGA